MFYPSGVKGIDKFWWNERRTLHLTQVPSVGRT